MSEADAPVLYAVLGDPIEHSLSPALHNAAIKALGLDAVYVALPIETGLVVPVMRALACAGGGGNVTIPHKETASRALDHMSEAVRATGACNLFWWDDERRLCGDNTDVEAFRIASAHLLGGALSGLRVLVIGAGGAARSVVFACITGGAAQINLTNRSRERGEMLIRDLGDPANVRLLASPSADAGARYDLVVNSTSLGLRESDPLPFETREVSAGAVLDLVYSPRGTRLVSAARDAGMKAEDGRRMLVEQAARAFEVWFGQEAPRSVMHEAVGLS